MRIIEDIKEQTEKSIADKCLSLLSNAIGIIAIPVSFICLYYFCYVCVKYHIVDIIDYEITKIILFIAIVICFKFIIAKWSKFKSFVQSNIVIFVLLTTYILFYHFWEKLIENHIVNNFFVYFEPTIINDSIFILAVSFCIILCYFNRGKNIKQSSKLINVIVILFWFYYRWFSDRFLFISLLSSETIKYIDIVPIYCLSKLIPLILKPHKVDYHPRKLSFIRDVPIKSLSNNLLLERKDFAKNVIESFFGINPYSDAFTYGIDASWGAGKTSFMNLMKEQISKVPIDNIIIDFNPWLLSTNMDYVTVFFEELSKSLKKYDYTLAKNLIDYSKLLTAFGTKETKIIAGLLDLNQHNCTLEEKKQQITDAIRRIERRIFVFIDDFDRLDADELMQMMKIIRNSSNFPFMFFVVAYDKSYLVRCLEKKMDIKGTDFLDKIFQHEFHLPPCPSRTLRKLLYDYIVSVVDNFVSNDNNELLDYIINDENNSNPLSVLYNIREVKRLANHFSSSYSYVKGKINVIDLLLFELFKTKYSLVFSFFERKKEEILVLDKNNHYLVFDGDLTESEDYINKIRFLNYIKTHNKEFNINDIDLRSIQTIIEFLFKKRNLQDNVIQPSRRLNDKDWFDRYINLTELESDISDKEFEEVMKRDFDAIKEALEKWLLLKKTVSLHYHIISYKAYDKEGQKKIIKSMFYYITHYKDIERKEKDEIISRLRQFNEDERYFSKEDKKFMKTTFREYSNNYNIYRYVGNIHRSSLGCLNDDDLIEIQHFYFNESIKKYGVTDPLQILHTFRLLLGYDYNNINRYSNRFNDGYSRELFKVMQNYVEMHLFVILPYIIMEEFKDDNYENNTGYYYIIDYVRLVWGTWDDFYNYIINLDNVDNQINSEFMEFLKAFKKNRYKKTLFSFHNFYPIGMALDNDYET